MNYLTKCIHALHNNGVRLREIARRLKLAPSTVYRVLHGHTLRSAKRCPQCGAKLIKSPCLACQLRATLEKPQIISSDEWDNYIKWDGQITSIRLELRPQEYARYLVVRKQKEEELKRLRYD